MPTKDLSKILHQDQFGHAMIRRIGEAGSHARFYVEPPGVNVQDPEQLVRLLARGKKMAYAAEVVVFLERQLVAIGNLHGHAGRRYEFQVRESVIGVVDDGIEDEIETADVSADDGAYLGGVAPFVPMRRVETEFEIHTVEDVAIVRVRLNEQRSQLEPVVQNRIVAGDRIQREIQSSLEPRGNAVRPFADSVERLVRLDSPRKTRRRAAAGYEVVVPGQIERAGRGDLGVINLNLVRLRANGGREYQRQQADR